MVTLQVLELAPNKSAARQKSKLDHYPFATAPLPLLHEPLRYTISVLLATALFALLGTTNAWKFLRLLLCKGSSAALNAVCQLTPTMRYYQFQRNSEETGFRI